MLKKISRRNILPMTFMMSLFSFPSHASELKADTTPPEITYTEERVGDREGIRATITANDESGIKEFRDHNGNLISDTSFDVEFSTRETPTFTAIDHSGNESSLTLDLNWINPYTTTNSHVVSSRKKYGSSYWESSTIREWLNSDGTEVEYTNLPPSDENTGNLGYDNESGFLHGFSDKEKEAIAITERRNTILSSDAMHKDGGNRSSNVAGSALGSFLGTERHQYLAFSHQNTYYKKTNDKVFLLNGNELYWYIIRRGNGFKKEYTSEAIDKHNILDARGEWYINSGLYHDNYDKMFFSNGFNGLTYQRPSSHGGVVPAIYLKPSYVLDNGVKASELRIGDCVSFGTYLNAEIEWEVINISKEGYPLLLSVKKLDSKVYDTLNDNSRVYSDHISYSDFDIQSVSNASENYIPTYGGTDIMPPSLEVLNKDELYIRQSGSFTLNIKFKDESGISFIKLPNGQIENFPNPNTEKIIDFKVYTNGYYNFEYADKLGNYNNFALYVSNINEEAVLEIDSPLDWTSSNAEINVKSSNSISLGIDRAEVSTDKSVRTDSLPNYISYVGKTVRVQGNLSLKEYDEAVIDRYPSGVINIYGNYRRVSESFYSNTSEWQYPRFSFLIKDLIEKQSIPFDFEYTVPSNFADELYFSFQSFNIPGNEERLTFIVDYEDIIVSVEDDCDFSISSIILPDGKIVEDVKEYTDTITEDGIHVLTYKVLDSRGVTTEKTITVKVDKTKPVLDLEYDYDKFEFLENKSLQVSLSGSDVLSGFKRIKLPDGSYTTSQNVTYTITDYGTHVFECEDTAGNITRKIVKVEDMSAFEDAESAVKNAELTNLAEDISNARDLVNRLPESPKKDELQDRLNAISPDISLDSKLATSNLDIYIKSENMLSLSLDTNSVSFDNFSGAEDIEKQNAINLTVSSSLPYKVNASLQSEIQNSDKSKTMDKSILNIKANSNTTYKAFSDILSPITLLDDQSNGNDMSHGIDLKLKGNIAHEKDVYKTTIKIEVEQK